MSRKQQATKENRKGGLHPRNKHRGRYDFDKLISSFPDLKPFVTLNRYDTLSIDFSDPLAVKALNRALLKQFYAIDHWDIPEGYLCPPIPGRADYIHHLADLLAADHQGDIPTGKKIHGLDIGVGANAVYPIIGCREYGWSFIGSDIDPVSVGTAQLIATSNKSLNKQFESRLQNSAENFFKGIIQPDERFDFTVCNPPFHASAADADTGSLRKLRNLAAGKGQPLSQQGKAKLNFGGQAGELWCKGGEIAFIRRMIDQSAAFSQQCYWFSTLVSKQDNLPAVYRALKGVKATRIETVKMAQGQKISRFVAWSFLSKAEQESWREERWGTAG
ncbi:MAG: 23S rRNA (adenine(1618)-N(6))-methyltransferase RlmF [Amphritea sp.]